MAIEFETFRVEDVREQFRRKAAALFPRLRQRLSWKYGGLYWETIPDQEFQQLEHLLYIDLKGQDIHNDKQLADYLAKEIQVKDPLYGPQWRLIIKEDY